MDIAYQVSGPILWRSPKSGCFKCGKSLQPYQMIVKYGDTEFCYDCNQRRQRDDEQATDHLRIEKLQQEMTRLYARVEELERKLAASNPTGPPPPYAPFVAIASSSNSTNTSP